MLPWAPRSAVELQDVILPALDMRYCCMVVLTFSALAAGVSPLPARAYLPHVKSCIKKVQQHDKSDDGFSPSSLQLSHPC